MGSRPNLVKVHVFLIKEQFPMYDAYGLLKVYKNHFGLFMALEESVLLPQMF